MTDSGRSQGEGAVQRQIRSGCGDAEEDRSEESHPQREVQHGCRVGQGGEKSVSLRNFTFHLNVERKRRNLSRTIYELSIFQS